MKKLKLTLWILFTLSFSMNSFAETKRSAVDIWSSIPFTRGADLCSFQNSYGQSRNEYMQDMIQMATRLMDYGSYGYEALEILKEFENLYNKNKELALRGKHIDVTLESTLKSSLSEIYRQRGIRNQKVNFKQMGSLRRAIDQLNRGQLPDNYNDQDLKNLDYIAYGSYSFSPNCKGKILVTLHLIGKDNRLKSYQSTGDLSTVMAKIAQDILLDFQRSDFPATIRVGSRTITILGALESNIGLVNRVARADQACKLLGGKLPNREELELIDMLGDYNGGISIGRKVWALSGNKVYHPLLQNPTPVRSESEVNTRDFYYYCIR